MELVRVPGVHQGQQFVVGLLERGIGPEQAEPAADAKDVHVDRDLGPVPGEDLDAGGGLSACLLYTSPSPRD